jgi:hypothetical protein
VRAPGLAAPRARRLPLRGADLVLLAMPALWPRAPVSNNVLLAVECDGAIDPGRVRAALDRFVGGCPWPAARLARAVPWGRLHWSAPPHPVTPPVRHAHAGSREALHGEIERELNARIDPWREAPLRLAIVDGGRVSVPASSTLLMTWFHPLMDPRGGQNLLGHLSRLDERPAPWDPSTAQPAIPPDTRPLRERGRIARRSLEHMRTLAAAPPLSPGSRLGAPGPARFRRDSFIAPEPAERAASTRDISWRLALVGRAMAGLWARRGLPMDVPFLVAIAVDLRPKGEPGPTFGNALAFHFARFRPAETGDVEALARSLRRQMADAVRDGLIEANRVAMEFLHYRPIRRMLREMPGAARRETFSFNCADVGEFPAAGSVFGRRVVDAYHVPAVSPRPGIGVFFNRCGARQNLIVSWIEGAVEPEDVADIVEIVRQGMGWTAER